MHPGKKHFAGHLLVDRNTDIHGEATFPRSYQKGLRDWSWELAQVASWRVHLDRRKKNPQHTYHHLPCEDETRQADYCGHVSKSHLLPNSLRCYTLNILWTCFFWGATLLAPLERLWNDMIAVEKKVNVQLFKGNQAGLGREKGCVPKPRVSFLGSEGHHAHLPGILLKRILLDFDPNTGGPWLTADASAAALATCRSCTNFFVVSSLTTFKAGWKGIL